MNKDKPLLFFLYRREALRGVGAIVDSYLSALRSRKRLMVGTSVEVCVSEVYDFWYE